MDDVPLEELKIDMKAERKKGTSQNASQSERSIGATGMNRNSTFS
ncbi:hypothetical protein [Lentibacillus salinarum]